MSVAHNRRTVSPAYHRRSILGVLLALVGSSVARPVRADATVVEMRKIAFAPAVVEVPVGATVTFVNLDLVPHTATASDKSFDTGTLKKDQRKDVTFQIAGEYPYICRFHPHMTGRIVVR